MSRVHDLKVWPEFFEPLSNGDKTFEVRRDDRGFSVGDTLRLREWDDGYSDREIVRAVTYILAGPLFGVEPGVVIMALAAPVAGEALREALTSAISVLENYGDHHEWCVRADGSAEACTCGLWVELEKLRAALAAPVAGGLDEERLGLLRALSLTHHIFDLPIGEDVTYSRGYSAGIGAAREVFREAIYAALAASQPVAEEGEPGRVTTTDRERFVDRDR